MARRTRRLPGANRGGRKLINARALVGSHDILLVTLDTLRFDVAQHAFLSGKTPFLRSILPPSGWELRHAPGNFTFASHMAFFAGFLPTPALPGAHPRLFAAKFAGSETATEKTAVFDAPDIVSGLTSQNYRTICIGGVGFFNGLTPLGSVLPNLFQRAFWNEEIGVTGRDSTRLQVELALENLAPIPKNERVFLFLNVSAIHQPNCGFSSGATRDSPATMGEALSYVDAQLPPLFEVLRRRAPLLCVMCADHGTAYGEDGFWGHRLAHPSVWNVPYAEMVFSQTL